MNGAQDSNHWKNRGVAEDAGDTLRDDARPETAPEAVPAEPAPMSARARRLLFGTNTLLALLFAAALLAMVNYLSARHYRRVDVSRLRPYELSPKTRQLLAGVSNRIEGILFFRPGHFLYEDTEALLREYEFACPRLHVEHVDPDREQTRAAEVIRKFGLTKANVVVFHAGDRNVVVNDLDLVELDTTGAEAGVPPRRKGFLGEQAFSTALLQLAHPRQPSVYFLLGHGERDPRDHDKYAGYSACARLLADDRIDVRPLLLSQSNAVPADADAVVIAGPRLKFPPGEVEALRRYLARSGRILLTLESRGDGALEPLMEEWGVRIGDGHMVDTSRDLSGAELFVGDYAPHPITAPLTNVTVVLRQPRPLEMLSSSGADKPAVSALLLSPAQGWAETDVDHKTIAFDAGQDRRGAQPVALAIERGPTAGVDMNIRPTRLVIVGDTDFASNGSLVGGNPDLMLNAMNWLLERADLLSIAPKPVERLRLVLDRRQLVMLFWSVVVVLPSLAALAGVLVWSRRRA